MLQTITSFDLWSETVIYKCWFMTSYRPITTNLQKVKSIEKSLKAGFDLRAYLLGYNYLFELQTRGEVCLTLRQFLDRSFAY